MLFAVVFIIIGTIFLLFASYNIKKIIQLLGRKRKNYYHWKKLFYLTLFFVAGYTCTICFLLQEWIEILIYLLGLVFFFGACFVLLVSYIGLGTIADMEEEVQIRTKAMYAAKQEADAANKAKSQFLAIMSHEIRTPLSSIIATIDLLDEIKLSKEAGSYVQIMSRAARNLLHQINSILDFSKIEAKRMELAEAPSLLHENIDNVLQIMQVRCMEKNIKLLSKIHLEDDLCLFCDTVRFEQILINLIGNAIKFTLHGSISLEILQQEEKDHKVKLSIKLSDTGIGIPPDKIDTIFDSFSQADASITRSYGGTGLGLPICKTLVGLMGGEIRVSSTLGAGSVFSFDLFLQRVKKEAKPVITKKIKSDAALKGMRVLLVEDNEDNRFLFQNFVSGIGIRMDTAENGVIALEKICTENEEDHYDLILMDIQMPIMDGLTAMTHIRKWEKERGKRALPILALTASSTKEDVMKSYSAGCTEYITKPIRKKALLDTILRYAVES